MSINLLADLGFDETAPEVQNARYAADAYARVIDDLVDCRASNGLSQKEVAARMKTSQSAVSELESANADARFSTLLRYAHAVDCALHIVVTPHRAASSKSWVNLIGEDEVLALPVSMENYRAIHRLQPDYTVDKSSFRNYDASA